VLEITAFTVTVLVRKPEHLDFTTLCNFANVLQYLCMLNHYVPEIQPTVFFCGEEKVDITLSALSWTLTSLVWERRYASEV
jgi:hypothetical protein